MKKLLIIAVLLLGSISYAQQIDFPPNEGERPDIENLTIEDTQYIAVTSTVLDGRVASLALFPSVNEGFNRRVKYPEILKLKKALEKAYNVVLNIETESNNDGFAYGETKGITVALRITYISPGIYAVQALISNTRLEKQYEKELEIAISRPYYL